MNVFVLIGQLSGVGEVISVCSTKETALASMAEEMSVNRSRLPRSGFDAYRELIVEEWEIDGKCVANWKALSFEESVILAEPTDLIEH